ncbi:hypothetical protein PSEUDO9AG_50604 [Pseudomonas sp. 9Ag]|nr:hypothetical protein PSEUDO9AG_50604 [Pseudomonas sp. 9Ag]
MNRPCPQVNGEISSGAKACGRKRNAARFTLRLPRNLPQAISKMDHASPIHGVAIHRVAVHRVAVHRGGDPPSAVTVDVKGDIHPCISTTTLCWGDSSRLIIGGRPGSRIHP